MFSHIMVGANDIEKSKIFYDKVLGTMGCEPGVLSVNPTGACEGVSIEFARILWGSSSVLWLLRRSFPHPNLPPQAGKGLM